MIYVVMKDGRVLQYNSANRHAWYTNHINLSRRNDDTYSVAKIALDMVERIESEKPCKISRPKTKTSRAY